MAKKAKAPEVQTEEVKVGQGVNDRVLYVIQKDTTVEIISEPSPEWYEVITPSGHGYCMQIFIKRT